MDEQVLIFAGRETKYLAKKIAGSYGQKLGEATVTEFADGEFRTAFEQNVRGRDVFLVQSTFAPSDNLFELLLMIDAARRASARKIVAVIPYFGFARQDRKDKPRTPITSKLIANLLTAAGVHRIVTIDLHADQIQGFFDVPVDHIYASKIFIPHLIKQNLPNLMMASPDTGGTRRAAAYSKILDTGFVICYKQRTKPNEIATMELIGDVSGKDVVLVDDIIDTAGSITRAANLIKSKGANSVRAYCTHPVFSGDAIQKIEDSAFTKVIVSDTIPLKKQSNKIEVISSADLFSTVIKRVLKTKSISSLYKFEN